MPLLQITTNTKFSANKKDEIMELASKMLSEILNKPELVIMVLFRSNIMMQFAKTTDPCAYLELKGLDFPENKTTELAKHICQFIYQQCQIDPARIFIEFSSVERHMWGWKNGTFRV